MDVLQNRVNSSVGAILLRVYDVFLIIFTIFVAITLPMKVGRG